MELLAPVTFFSTLALLLLLRAYLHARRLVPVIGRIDDDVEQDFALEDDYFDLAAELEKDIREAAKAAEEENVIDAELVVLSDNEAAAATSVVLPPQKRRPRGKRARRLSIAQRKWWVQVGVSGIVLLSALAIIFLREEDQEAQKWAFGTIGLILGFWLKE